jgi:hypothetical protein
VSIATVREIVCGDADRCLSRVIVSKRVRLGPSLDRDPSTRMFPLRLSRSLPVACNT